MHQLTRYLAKDATSCDVLVANPRCTGPFPRSPPTLATPKIIFPGVSLFCGREAEDRLRAALPCGTFWASPWWERGWDDLFAPQKTQCHAQPQASGLPSCSSKQDFPACHRWATQGGRRWDQTLSPLFIRSCLLTVRLTFPADKDISDLSTRPNKTTLWWEL